MKRNITYTFICLLAALFAAGCAKDGADDPVPGIGEGECAIDAAVEFSPLGSALEGRTRTAGTAIRNIRTLCVLLYDTDGKLAGRYPIEKFDEKLVDRADTVTEKQTPRAEFKLTVPYGRYRIYAVANMGDMSEYADRIGTIDGLKSISFDWQPTVADNAQMFGQFDSDKEGLIAIDRRNMTLHAWIRRAASKVTVAFDGSRLEEGVFIYLKSVQIRDIPKSCVLGNPNTPTDPKTELIAEGEQVVYATGTGYDESWPARITKGRPYYPYDPDTYDKAANTHSDDNPASLFFYENMQGKGESKRQDWKNPGHITYPDGNDPDQPGYKDNKPCGTYVEVRAFYRSIHPDRVGNGDIVYRFMLGKDTETNYDAERNYHYKLTLRFNRFANDVDWHIDYEETVPSIQVPSYYISYLYNHSTTLPVKVNVGNYRITKFTAEIDSNAWAPYNAPKSEYYSQLDPAVTPGITLHPGNGFLSLRKTKETVLFPDFFDTSDNGYNNKNDAYFRDEQRGYREYETVPGTHEDAENGSYRVTENTEERTVTFQVPLYTRAKQLIPRSGHTGNNPFVAYRRRATVKFTAELTDDEGHTNTIVERAPILQVRRVVNPKGIWRKHDSTNPFHVVLKHLSEESSQEFKTFTSEGTWRAYVVRGDKDLVSLDGKAETGGSTGTPIDFWVRFNGTCNENESRCAIIRVEYHNNSCYHLIFVRQGKAPMALIPGGAKWHACNMRTATEEASCPAEEGSLFRFANWDQPIDALSNVNDRTPWANITQGDFKDHAATPLLMAGTDKEGAGTRIPWKDIRWSDPTTNPSARFTNPTVDAREVRVASYEDYQEFLDNSDVIEQGFGVLYGNDATETLSKIEEVYGHRRDTHGDATGKGAGYGMRGCFVYNRSEDPTYGGRNLFFPLGTAGYGHRKHGEARGTAVLRYSSGQTAPMTNFIQIRPLFYDLYMRPGAIYWLGGYKTIGDKDNALAWDLNYFTFDFNHLPYNNVFSAKDSSLPKQSDACFVRCVELDK